MQPGDDLAALIAAALDAAGARLEAGDIVCVTQKVVSKAEGRLVDLAAIEPSPVARSFAAAYEKDPRLVEVVLRESSRIVRMDHGVIIAETRQGFVCANAGVDVSNLARPGVACLLPEGPDRSAEVLRRALRQLLGVEVPVIITDTFGRPWRDGAVNVAIGVAGLAPLADYRGEADSAGRRLAASLLAVADELASAAELVMGKLARRPVAIVRGYPFAPGEGSGRQLLMPPERDLFR